ncbi:MAG: tetratricopeptide repeat protein [Gammaproteobacteria bacterium]|nr:tetratricopeptide repeat protein [Gammaproteobacteria bacterium]
MNTNFKKAGKAVTLLLLVSGFTFTGFSVQSAEKDTTDEQYRAAMFLREQGKLLEAIEAFNTILANQPTLHRARIELAVAHFRARNYAQARINAQKVLDDPKTPVNVKIAINSFLVQLKIEEQKLITERKVWKPSLSFGLMHDDNVNAGPSSDVIQLGGAPFAINPSSLPRSDWAATAFGSLEHTWLADKPVSIGNTSARLYWNTLGQLYHREYDTDDDFDLSVVSLATGPALLSMHNWRANLKFQYDYIALDGEHLADYFSATPSVTWQFKNADVTLDMLVQERRFKRTQDVGRDGLYTQIGASYGRVMNNKKLGIQVGARKFNYEADTARFGYDGRELFAGANYVAWQNGSVYGRISRKVSRYDDIENGFGIARDETEDKTVVGFKHKFKGNKLDNWVLDGSFTTFGATSNVGIFDYDRDQVAFTLSRSF